MTRSFALAGIIAAAVLAPSAACSGPETEVATSVTPAISAPAGGSFFGLTPQFAVSPDGRHVVFVANAPDSPTTLWVQSGASEPPRSLPGTEQASYPFWSADSESIGFFASGKLLRIPASGGPSVVVCDAPTGRGGTWNADDVIVFTSGITDPLRRVAASGGQPAAVTVVDTTRENSHRWPQFLPDGRHILFWAGAGSAPPELKIAALDGADVVSVAPADTNAAIGPGHLFFGRGDRLMALPFDPSTRQVTGEAIVVAEPLSRDAGSSFASVSASSEGDLLFTSGDARGFVLTWFDRSGQRLGILGEAGLYTNAAISPDGSRVAVSLTQGTPPNRDIWMLDAVTGAPTRVTDHASVDATPVWSPDGSAVVFSSQRNGPYQMFRRPLAEGSSDELLLRSDVSAIATDWSRDGQVVAYTRGTAASGLDVWALPLSGAREPLPAAQDPAAEDSGVFSPDGRWLAYQSNATGRSEIHVRPAPSPGAASGQPDAAPVQVSRDGGTQPLWRADGEELFFLALDGAVTVAAVRGESGQFTSEAPQRLFSAPVSLVIRRSYDVSADGQRFLIPLLDDRVPQTITLGRFE
jgi:Tol biopolymer transport system component